MKAYVLRAYLFLGFGLLILASGVLMVATGQRAGPPSPLPARVQGLGSAFFGLLLTAYGLRLALQSRHRKPHAER